jgi:excisionase family DNA binding protein
MGAAMTSNRSAAGAAPRFFTIAAVAEFFAVSTRTVRRWIERGDLITHRFGSAVRIADSDLKTFVARQRQL